MTSSNMLIAFSLVLAGCTPINSRVATKLNITAAVGGDIAAPSDPLQWKVITSGVNPQRSTMYTLYGNDLAVHYARATAKRDYPDGAVLALVTWQQQEDVRWFGARIPARPQSVEFLSVEDRLRGNSRKHYRRLEGSPLTEVRIPPTQAEQSAFHILKLRAAVMP